MTELQQKQKAFLDEMISHYNINNRGVQPEFPGLCSYKAGCAIGRKIPPELAIKLDADMTGSGVSNHHIFEQLPMELQELTKPFLEDIQSLHDAPFCWSTQGLSSLGVERANGIKDRYNLWPETSPQQTLRKWDYSKMRMDRMAGKQNFKEALKKIRWFA